MGPNRGEGRGRGACGGGRDSHGAARGSHDRARGTPGAQDNIGV